MTNWNGLHIDKFNSYFIRMVYFVTIFLTFGNPAAAEKVNVTAFILPPWGMEEPGQAKGIIPDVLSLLEQETGHEITVTMQPYKQMIIDLKSGDSDFSIFFRSASSEAIADQVAMLIVLDTVVINPKGADLASYSDLSGKTIAVPKGVFLEKRFDEDTSLKKLVLDNYREVAQAVKDGRADLAAGPMITLRKEFNNLGIDKDSLGNPLVLQAKEVWLQFSKNSSKKSLHREFQEALELLVESGLIFSILSEYY
ncbi:MAG: transporter substrate-binding domain-containing protein [Halopseudomonas aestusnigri]